MLWCGQIRMRSSAAQRAGQPNGYGVDDFSQPRGQVAGQDELISNPLASTLLNTVAERESRDIVKNLRVLDDIVSAPAPIKTAL